MAQGYEQGSYGQGSFLPGGGSGLDDRPSGTAVPTGPRRARVGLIALVAFLLELVIIAAGANQAVSKHLVSYVEKHSSSSFVTSMVEAALTFSWRLTPQHGDSSHIWLSEIVRDVSVLVLTVLLVLAIARGPITWGRAFFGIWMIVIVSTCLAAIPSLLVTKHLASPGVNKATYAVFSGPNAYVFFAGAALGLIVALITSIVAIATRRPGVALEPGFVPDESARLNPEPPPPYYGDAAPGGWSQPSSNQTTPYQPSNQPPPNQAPPNQAPSNQPPPHQASPRSESPTTAYPVVESGTTGGKPAQSGPAQSEPTTTLPRFDNAWHPGQRSGEPPQDGAATSELPRSETPAAEPPKSEPPNTEAARSEQTGTWPAQPAQPAGGQPTAAFPRPPDDEDLGQHPDHD